jgi:hypothetical protein
MRGDLAALSILAALAGWGGNAAAATCRPDPAATYSPAKAERYIHQGEAAWAASVMSNGALVVKRILSDDYIGVSDGQLMDKAAAVKEAEAGPGHFVSNQLDYAHVRFFGTTAVVQGRENWVMRDPPRKGHFIWTDTWVLCGRAWRIVNAQDISVVDAGK